MEPRHRTGSQIADAEIPHGVAGKIAPLIEEKPSDLCGKLSRPPANMMTKEPLKLQQVIDHM